MKSASHKPSANRQHDGGSVQSDSSMTSVIATCRAGFEADLVAEIELAMELPAARREAAANSGFAALNFSPTVAPRLARLAVDNLVFARQLFRAGEQPISLPNNDRVTPIMAAIDAIIAAPVSDVWLEYPDTNEGKALSTAARAIAPRLQARLLERGLIDKSARQRLHVMLTPSRSAWVGVADVETASRWPLGIPRMRFPTGAPSRSTLKLAEALQHFLGENEAHLLQAEMRAVDLGAAPGGWTWQLVHRGVRVTAIDNGALKGDLVDNAMVKHLRMDGFKFAPKVPVDWMVCDMVEQPSRIANLAAKWLTQGWARHAIFNLKLPMKKRLAEIDRCRAIVADAAHGSGRPLLLSIKQLYHDREEVTAYCRPATAVSSRKR